MNGQPEGRKWGWRWGELGGLQAPEGFLPAHRPRNSSSAARFTACSHTPQHQQTPGRGLTSCPPPLSTQPALPPAGPLHLTWVQVSLHPDGSKGGGRCSEKLPVRDPPSRESLSPS